MKVDDELLKFRKVVLSNKRPRRIQIQPEVVLKDGDVQYVNYEPNFYSCIESNLEHLREVDDELLEMIKKNKPFKNIE